MPSSNDSKTCDEILNQYFHTAKKSNTPKLNGFDEKLERRDEILAEVKKL